MGLGAQKWAQKIKILNIKRTCLKNKKTSSKGKKKKKQKLTPQGPFGMCV